MIKKVYVAAIAVSMAGLTACGSGNTNKQKTKEAAEVAEVAEIAETPQDCKLEEGYVWSELEQRCVPIFDEGIAFTSMDAPILHGMVYVKFSPDSLHAQVFNMGTGQSEILERRMTPNGPVWNVEDDDTKNIRQQDGKWIIEKRGEKVYEHVKDIKPVEARFQGSDGITRMIHWVDVTFYPASERATVKIGDKEYNLKQYPTASGYGYKNDQVDLRGKGKDAMLHFADEDMRDLTLIDVTEEEKK